MSPESYPDYPAKPVRPDEIIATRINTFPDEVFIAVNGLIAERLHGQYATFTINALRKRMEVLGLDKQEIKEKGWDRIGSIYEQNGWKVYYHSPSMDDSDFRAILHI